MKKTLCGRTMPEARIKFLAFLHSDRSDKWVNYWLNYWLFEMGGLMGEW